jgi:ribulose-5-phosphate 4-epimerase/fuculose-1-phosphate aldolase
MLEVAQSLRDQVACACRILALEGYVDLTLGHVSARAAAEQTLYIKRKGVALDEVRREDVVSLDLGVSETDLGPEMHLETVIHTEIYKLRPDVAAVVHGHPPFATALGATEANLEFLTHDAVLFPEGVPVFEETAELITAPEEGRAVAAALGAGRALLLANHGVVVVGKDVPWAVLAAVTLERAARLQAIASSIGPLRTLSAGAVERLHSSKYADRLVEEYWASWIRRLRRAGQADGMPPA